MPDPTWLGTISALAGTVLGGFIGAAAQSLRDRRTRRHELETRWDKAFIEGVAEYLTMVDAEYRALRRLHQASPSNERWHEFMREADEAVDAAERKSNFISLLSGERTHPVRVASRSMREALREMQVAARNGHVLSPQEIDTYRKRWLAAREDLIRYVQGGYMTHSRRSKKPTKVSPANTQSS